MSATLDAIRVGQATIGELILEKGLDRRYNATEFTVAFPLDLTGAKVWDSGQPLPATPANDDIGLVAGTFGTGTVFLSCGERKAQGATTRYCRILATLPQNFIAGQSVSLQLVAGMKTTIADASATVDAEAFLVGGSTLVSGTDLVATAAQSINSTTFAAKNFVLSSGGLQPGDQLDIRITLTCNDAASVTDVIAAIAAVKLLCDVRG